MCLSVKVHIIVCNIIQLSRYKIVAVTVDNTTLAFCSDDSVAIRIKPMIITIRTVYIVKLCWNCLVSTLVQKAKFPLLIYKPNSVRRIFVTH